MARRSDHSRNELAELVIAAARDIVAEEGARGVTMRRIAGMIGYAAGSIYNAVGDIDIVLMRVNAGTLELLGATLEAVIAAGGDQTPIQRARLIAETYMDFVAAHAPFWAALLERPPAPDQPVPDWYAAPRARLIEIVAETLAPLFANADERRRSVIALWAALQGVAALVAGGNLAFAGPQLNAKEIALSIVDRYLTGHEPRH